jgi:trehalose 6-phosphate phosphatase
MIEAPPAPSLYCCLFLDVDGTLIELTDTPSQTVADPEIKTLLGQLSLCLGGAVALVSGRQITTLDQLFAPLRLPSSGLHGMERRTADGVMEGGTSIDPKLDHARAEIAKFAATYPGALLEDKRRTVAIHFRLAPAAADSARQLAADILAQLGDRYMIQPGDMMLEIKPHGFTKATAISSFMLEAPFAGRQPVFIGDDLTDQHGFPVVEAMGGMSIGVGDRVQGQYHLDTVGEVRAWLKRIAAQHDPRAGGPSRG